MHVTCLREGGVETDLGFWQGSFQIGVGGWHGGVVELAVRRILIVDLAPAGSGWAPSDDGWPVLRAFLAPHLLAPGDKRSIAARADGAFDGEWKLAGWLHERLDGWRQLGDGLRSWRAFARRQQRAFKKRNNRLAPILPSRSRFLIHAR